MCLFSVITAADKYIEFLRSENEKLCAQVNNLRSEVDSIRHALSIFLFLLDFWFLLIFLVVYFLLLPPDPAFSGARITEIDTYLHFIAGQPVMSNACITRSF